MNTEVKIPSFTISHEELALLLQILRAPGLMGFEEKPLAELTQEQTAMAMVSAERSLRARGLIRLVEEEKRIEIDTVVMAFLGTCLTPDYSIMITSTKKEGMQGAYYYHVSTHLAVENYSPESGLYRFSGAERLQDLFPNIERVAHLENQPAPAKAGGRIKEKILTQARDASRAGKKTEAADILKGGGLSAVSSKALVATLEAPINNGSVIRLDFEKEQAQSTGFSFLEGRAGIWILTPEEDSDPLWIRIEPCSAEEIRNRLRTLINGNKKR